VDNPPERRELGSCCPGKDQLQLRMQSGLVDLPGAWSFQTPCLITTHKIRQITANFTGTSNVIQSICTISFYLTFQALLIYLGFDPSSTGTSGN
jgi:hypothetical protein